MTTTLHIDAIKAIAKRLVTFGVPAETAIGHALDIIEATAVTASETPAVEEPKPPREPRHCERGQALAIMRCMKEGVNTIVGLVEKTGYKPGQVQASLWQLASRGYVILPPGKSHYQLTSPGETAALYAVEFPFAKTWTGLDKWLDGRAEAAKKAALAAQLQGQRNVYGQQWAYNSQAAQNEVSR